MTTTLKYSREMERLLSGEWVNQCLGTVAKEVFQSTIGSSGITKKHFSKRQTGWPKLAASTRTDRRKKSKKLFSFNGTVEKAITNSPNMGKLAKWGAGTKKRLSYRANGIYSAAGIGKDGFWIATGFSGRLKNSKGFDQKRHEIALKKGVKLDGLTRKNARKLINSSVSVGETHSALKKSGGGTKFLKKQGKDNLAYADIVQAGPFLGLKNSKTGEFFAADKLHGPSGAIKTGKIGKNFSEVRGKKPRPLLPYDQGDVSTLQLAMERGVEKTLRGEFA